jgi:hypothetical protein
MTNRKMPTNEQPQSARPADVGEPATAEPSRLQHMVARLADQMRPAETPAFRVWPDVDEDGWCEWQMPIMEGYQMQCCDCGLVHEVEFNVAEWKGEQRVEFRMRRAPPPAQQAPHTAEEKTR